MNKFIGIGRITKDLELKQTTTGKTYCNFSIAIDRKIKTEGQAKSDFFNCTVWGITAENFVKYLAKGRKVGIIGKLRTDSWEKDGVKRTQTTIDVDEFEFVDNKQGTNENSQSSSAETECEESELLDPNDLPF